MGDWPDSPFFDGTCANAISSLSLNGIGPGFGTLGTLLAWPTANRAFFVPFRIAAPVTVYKMACGTGTATTGNFDLGIYDWSGNRLVSTGTTAKTTASSERVVDVTDTRLAAGRYYLAMAVDGTGAYLVTQSSATVGLYKLAGLRAMASAFPLPATATFATTPSAVIPGITAYLRAD